MILTPESYYANHIRVMKDGVQLGFVMRLDTETKAYVQDRFGVITKGVADEILYPEGYTDEWRKTDE